MSEPDDIFESLSESLFEKIKVHPIIPRDRENFTGTAGWRIDRSEIGQEYQGLFHEYVVPLTCLQAAYSSGVFTDEQIEAFGLDKVVGESELSNVPYDYYCQSIGLDIFGMANLSVDLGVPDKILMRQFKSFLGEARKVLDYKESPSMRDQTPARILEARVIPYLDLSTWFNTESLTIPDHVIGNWLFPDDMIDVAEKIRKTTRPLAKRAISEGFVNSLAAIPKIN